MVEPFLLVGEDDLLGGVEGSHAPEPGEPHCEVVSEASGGNDLGAVKKQSK